MNTLMQSGRRLAAAGALLAGVLLASGTAPIRAQDVPLDSRWQAWLGCWVPVGESAPEGAAEARRVCVIPATGSAVEVVTLEDWRVVGRDRVETTGERRPVTRGDCSGWESAEWSADGRRVYLRAEYACRGGLNRSSTGLMAMSPKGEWLDVQGVAAADGAMGVRVIRFHEAVVASLLPDDVKSALEGLGPAAGMARAAAAAPLTMADVVEVVGHVDAAVVEAWLAEQGQRFALDARRLFELADAGVPDRVIDLMVALSNPRFFAVNSGTRAIGRRRIEGGGPSVPAPIARDSGWGDGYDYHWLYGFPYGYDWYPGNRSVIVTQRVRGDGKPEGHGRVVRGSGYADGARGSGSAAGSAGSSSPSTTLAGSSSRGSSSSGTSSGSGSGSSTGRTAHPRP